MQTLIYIIYYVYIFYCNYDIDVVLSLSIDINLLFIPVLK